MASMLNQYYEKRAQMDKQLAAAPANQGQIMVYQELLYRINVLENCMLFCKTVPITTDQRILSCHYCVVDAFLRCILEERRFGVPADEKMKGSRKAAHSNLNVVITSFRKGFSNFTAGNEMQYKEKFSLMTKTVLPAWLAYRNTYINI